MPKILAVDDSVTMRRVLELTFAGLEGFEVVSFDNGDAALQHAQASGADLVIADASMSPDGYDLCQRLKAGAQTSGIPVIILASQHTPLDAEKAKSVGADDTALKPYDTNAFLEKVRGIIAKGGARAPAAQVATYRTAPAAAAAPSSSAGSVAAKRPTLELAEDDEPVITVEASPAAPVAPAPPGIIGRPAAPAAPVAPPAAKPPMRTTMGFGSPSAPVAKPPTPAAAPLAAATPIAAARPATATLGTAPVAPSPAASAASAAAAAVAPKLEGMGLTPEQSQGVLALTREVIVRVVWEVVPDLAETIIREEIQRLTK